MDFEKKIFQRNNGNRGQALTELMVILVAICIVLLSAILFSVTGIRGVKNVISAREEADRRVVNQTAASSGTQISYWANIEGLQGDGLQFTADDIAVTGGGTESGVYRKELVTTNGELDMTYLAAQKNEKHFRNFDLAAVRIFFQAADLTSGSAQIHDVLDDKKLYDVKNAMKKFGISTDIRIEDRVYMPKIYSK